VFDPALIPPEVWPPAAVRQLHEMLARLAARRVDRIALREPISRFRLSNMIRVYCQSHLRRCLVLVDSAHGLFFTENGLVSLMAIRAVYETVANFLDFERRLQRVLSEGELQKIHDFVHARTYATRLQKFIDFAETPEVQATNILTQIDRMNTIRATVRQEYDYLCEHTHPNAFGGVLYFADLQAEETTDTAVFHDAGPAPADDLQWIIVGTHMLRHFEDALNRIEAQLPALSAKGLEQSPHKPATN
jgi:hypothetical protein